MLCVDRLYSRRGRLWLLVLASLCLSPLALDGQEAQRRKLSNYIASSPLWTETFRSSIAEKARAGARDTLGIARYHFALPEGGHEQSVYLLPGEGEEDDRLVIIGEILLHREDSYIAVYNNRWEPMATELIGLPTFEGVHFYQSDGSPEGVRLSQLLYPLYLSYKMQGRMLRVEPRLSLSEEDKRNERLGVLIRAMSPRLYAWERDMFVPVSEGE